MASAPNALLGDNDAAGSNTRLLSAILNEISASEFLHKFIEDYDDDSIVTLSKLKPERIVDRYGLPLDLASAFVEKCRVKAGTQRPGASANDFSSVSSMSSSISSASSPATLVDDAALLRKLNLEIVGELGKGGFGTVFKCKNLADKLIVAVKLVNDPKNAKEAMREGQRLRRVKHKNIVIVHRVHDLNPILGNGTCALEMEAVAGGDLFQHIDASRRRPEPRLPHAAVLRFSRQLLEALVYLHDTMKWLHGDIKPQNILMQCNPVPADGSDVDYSSAEIKLADFGLAKVMDQKSSTASFMLSNASTQAGVIKGTMWYLSPEALQGSVGGYDRTYTDDLWSACLVILEMDTGLSLQQLMTAPGAVKLDEMLTKASPELLPVLNSVLAAPDAASRYTSAAELLRKLDASMDPLFIWQCYDATHEFVSVHPASSVALEVAFCANQPHTMLPLQPPLDLNFDIQALLTSPTALGFQTERKSGNKCTIRRLLKSSALTSSAEIPIWQELVDGKEWLQCCPTMCAKLNIDAYNPKAAIDSARYRRVTLESSSICSVQLPHLMKSEPYLAPARASDIEILSKRVHESLPEWDITDLVQVVNPTLASKYAAYRHRVAARCNGDPNERTVFHFASPFVIPKIWQEGEGHDPRLSLWAEVGKGAYFSKHLMYGFAYKYSLWPSPSKFEVKPEPPVGETMQVFATLVCLGNVANMGPGCETCPSPAWDLWKKEFEYQKSAENPSPKPTRPPAMSLPSDAAHRQHLLDLMQVKDAPRYDSVVSTEGDLATHPASTNKTPAGQRVCDIMHPRLKARANEWAEQFILFETAASYPMFIITVTKTRESPMGPQQLMDAGCDATRIKALGFTARDVKALSKTVQDMRTAGWPVLDVNEAGFNTASLLSGGYSASELKTAGFTALQLKYAGCSAQQLKGGGFSAAESRDAGFDLVALDAAGYDYEDLKIAGYSDSLLCKVHCRFYKSHGLDSFLQFHPFCLIRTPFVSQTMAAASYGALKV
jgi:serine/threonine protein kinase